MPNELAADVSVCIPVFRAAPAIAVSRTAVALEDCEAVYVRIASDEIVPKSGDNRMIAAGLVKCMRVRPTSAVFITKSMNTD
jgi:hypothetical protein